MDQVNEYFITPNIFGQSQIVDMVK